MKTEIQWTKSSGRNFHPIVFLLSPTGSGKRKLEMQTVRNLVKQGMINDPNLVVYLSKERRPPNRLAKYDEAHHFKPNTPELYSHLADLMHIKPIFL